MSGVLSKSHPSHRAVINIATLKSDVASGVLEPKTYMHLMLFVSYSDLGRNQNEKFSRNFGTFFSSCLSNCVWYVIHVMYLLMFCKVQLVSISSIFRCCSCLCPVFFAAGHAMPLDVKAGFLLNDIFFDCTTTTTYAILMVYAKQMVFFRQFV